MGSCLLAGRGDCSWLKTEMVTEISLDHDLEDDDRGTGYDVILSDRK